MTKYNEAAFEITNTLLFSNYISESEFMKTLKDLISGVLKIKVKKDARTKKSTNKPLLN